MELQQLASEAMAFTERVKGINSWIQGHPEVTEPNPYEIMDCNVGLAAILSQYAQQDGKQDLQASVKLHPEIVECWFSVMSMDTYRDTEHHPFFRLPEVNALYTAVKRSCLAMDYVLPQDLTMRIVKRELLCKCMSVPFYIWQVQGENPRYQYDNAKEFGDMREMLALYKVEGNEQFVPEMEALFNLVNQNYKYRETKKSEKQA